MKQRIIIFTGMLLLTACSGNKLEEKGFSVSSPRDHTEEERVDGLSRDSLKLKTKPSNVLLTGDPNYRLATIYKVNINKKTKTTFIGTNYFHYNYTERGSAHENQWHDNFMPGFEAVYGYNMVNISHYDISADKQKYLFPNPVLVKTLYYPSYSRDTLNARPVNRDYFMVSVYDDDTNKDGFINGKDLRRFYWFNIKGDLQKPLVPEDHSVIKSEYDPANDFMYVFAQWDENGNGQQDESEAIHIFWIDLNDPKRTGREF